jgi:hypothetical protein
MPPIEDEIEAMFNVPVDGSNIKDADDGMFSESTSGKETTADDDDNGYASLSAGDPTVPFEEKAAELASVVAAAAPGVSLFSPPQEPAPKPSEEDLLKQSILDVPSKVADPAGVLPLAEDAPSVEVARDTPASQIGDELEGFETPTAAPATPEEGDVLGDFEPVAVTQAVPEKNGDTVMSGAGNADKESVGTQAKESEKDDEVVYLTGAPSSNKEGWILDPPAPKWSDFYNFKRSYLSMLLIGGRLPFDDWMAEFSNASGDVHTSYDLDAMYVRLEDIQGWKNRVREIQIQMMNQYFLWKRVMDIMRSKAAKTEGDKVAWGDEASCPHLTDFEGYWARLEGCVKGGELVMRNLDSASDTLNRGITIALQAHERGIERFEPRTNRGVSKTVQQEPKQPTAQHSAFDSLDEGVVVLTGNPTKRAEVGNGWESVKSW